MPSILVTPGEPAGIGPELVCKLAADTASDWVAVADPELLVATAEWLGQPLEVMAVDALDEPIEPKPGRLHCWPTPLCSSVLPGQLDASNAPYVIECLNRASAACLAGDAQAWVTGPVHKGIINEAGITFTGHTEYLRDQAGLERVVMMLATHVCYLEDCPLRVALVTTHLPLAEVPMHITRSQVSDTICIVAEALERHFGLEHPQIAVLGLNPHAGEGGHLGREEIEIIEPVIRHLCDQGFNIEGPLSADTAFVPERVRQADAFIAMYHDQGLPVLKHAGFGHAVNITLGLPYIRTSVDHGTALDIAGQGVADLSSLEAALAAAQTLSGPSSTA